MPHSRYPEDEHSPQGEPGEAGDQPATQARAGQPLGLGHQPAVRLDDSGEGGV